MKYFLTFTFLTSVAFAQTSAAPAITQVPPPVSTKESETAPSTNASLTSAPSPATVFERKIDLFGDLRYRHQAITSGSNQERRVNRLLFRVGQSIQVQDDLKITYRVMTGTSATGGNVTLGDSKASGSTPGAPRQAFALDQAYGTYNLDKESTFFIGKFPQLHYAPGKNQVVLDRDVSLEGAAAQYKTKFLDDSLSLNLNLAGTWVREKYDETLGEDVTDSFLNIAQLNLAYKLNDLQFLVGYGIFSYTAIKDDKPGSFVPGGTLTTSAKGNTLDVLGNYQNNYETVQNYVELKWTQKPFDISIFFEADQNTAASQLNKATTYGATLTFEKWSLSYMEEKIEKDAVFAQYTDSDFADGQTSAKGTITALSYKMNKNAQLSYALYKTQQPIDLVAVNATRSHLDLTLSF